MARNHPLALKKQLLEIKAGLAKVLASGKKMNFRGGMADLATLNAVIDEKLKLLDNVDTAKIARGEAIKTRTAGLPWIAQLLEDIEIGAQYTWGKRSTECLELGFFPKKEPAPLSSEAKVRKAERNRATRKARGTLGPKARKKIKGKLDAEPPPPPKK
ncbi:MAG TPA: hypothetical protein VFF73_30075 [Planctomycetota bacterium]|nr:hypothetical protein [Planctomycetota bacterium]